MKIPATREVLTQVVDGRILVVTMNRPAKRNALSDTMNEDLNRVFDWFEDEPDLFVAIITGAGDKVFCAGADLKAWNQSKQAGSEKSNRTVDWAVAQRPTGFGGLSLRVSNKPIIAALNGSAYGGGAEMAVNCDIIVMPEDAVIGFPEPKRGVSAAAGGIARLNKIAGSKLASEALFTGRPISAIEARDRYRIVNHTVPKQKVLAKAIELAREICTCSPDSVQFTKKAMNVQNYGGLGDNEAVKQAVLDPMFASLNESQNMKEGLLAFSEKRDPKWTSPRRRTSPHSIKAVVFDIGGVVVGSPFQGIADYEKEHGLPKHYINVLIADLGKDGAFHQHETNQIDFGDFIGTDRFGPELCDSERGHRAYATYCKKRNLPLPKIRKDIKIDSYELYGKMMQPARQYDIHVKSVLDNLRKSGKYKLAALTNNTVKPEATVKDADKYYGLPVDVLKPSFDVFVESAIEGIRKPNPAFYQIALDRLGVKAEEAVMIDDIGVNLKAASKLGMHTIQVHIGHTEDAMKQLEKLLGEDLLHPRSKL